MAAPRMNETLITLCEAAERTGRDPRTVWGRTRDGVEGAEPDEIIRLERWPIERCAKRNIVGRKQRTEYVTTAEALDRFLAARDAARDARAEQATERRRTKKIRVQRPKSRRSAASLARSRKAAAARI